MENLYKYFYNIYCIHILYFQELHVLNKKINKVVKNYLLLNKLNYFKKSCG